MSVCEDCKFKEYEELTKGLFCLCCEEESENFMTDDGCYHYEERKEDYDGA